MKSLLVLRHAKAERDSDSGEDIDRPLAERGWRDAEAVGREMRARGLAPDSVLASPARRAAETVEAVARGYGPLQANYEPDIYEASVDRLMAIVRGVNDGVERLLLVGHNPGFERLALQLSGDDPSGYRERIADGLPTSAVAAIELPVDRWSEVIPQTGRIVDLIVPKELD